MTIEDVAGALYALAPQEFTAARNARGKEAKAAGDSELSTLVQSLRKPTTGAWLLNQLVRRHSDDVGRVLDLGARLRAAQGTLGADELRALDQQRRQLTRAVAGQACDLGRDAGRQVSEQTTIAVEETLRSAMVDAAAGAALSTGLLTDTFSSTGIEPVDLSRVVALAVPPAPPAASVPPDPAHRHRVAKAEHAVAAAGAALRASSEQAARAREQVTKARQQREQLEAERDEVRRRLGGLDAQVASSTEAEDAATRAHAEATQDQTAAVESAARLARELEELLGT